MSLSVTFSMSLSTLNGALITAVRDACRSSSAEPLDCRLFDLHCSRSFSPLLTLVLVSVIGACSDPSHFSLWRRRCSWVRQLLAALTQPRRVHLWHGGLVTHHVRSDCTSLSHGGSAHEGSCAASASAYHHSITCSEKSRGHCSSVALSCDVHWRASPASVPRGTVCDIEGQAKWC